MYKKRQLCTHLCCLCVLSTEVCHALNVTVTPGPVVMTPERDNLTLSCLVSQRKRSGSVLILRWFFSPLASPTLPPPPAPPSPSPPVLEASQYLIVKMGIKKMKLYGNYTRRFPQPKFRLFEETEAEVFQLWVLNVTRTDQGFYTCKVQEIRRHRNTWRASSNGTSTTQLTGNWSCILTHSVLDTTFVCGKIQGRMWQGMGWNLRVERLGTFQVSAANYLYFLLFSCQPSCLGLSPFSQQASSLSGCPWARH